MTITYQLNSSDDIDKNFIDSVKAVFKNRPLKINIEVDDNIFIENSNENELFIESDSRATALIQHLIHNDPSFQFLKEEEDLYSLDDLKVKY